MVTGDLCQKWAVVTGASQGIGAEIARVLAARGARVVLVARDRDALDRIAADLEDAVVVPADLADPDAPAEVITRIAQVTDTVDVLVNNAAAAVRCPISELDGETIDRLNALNVRAPLLLIGGLLPMLRRSSNASVINLSSISGLVGTPNRAAYAATKGAVDAFTRSLANELGPDGIRVNAVAPGVVDTQLWARNKKVDGVVEAIEDLTPLRRWGRTEDIAPVVAFLASDDAAFITGETISVDGGMAVTSPLYGGAV